MKTMKKRVKRLIFSLILSLMGVAIVSLPAHCYTESVYKMANGLLTPLSNSSRFSSFMGQNFLWLYLSFWSLTGIAALQKDLPNNSLCLGPLPYQS